MVSPWNLTAGKSQRKMSILHVHGSLWPLKINTSARPESGALINLCRIDARRWSPSGVGLVPPMIMAFCSLETWAAQRSVGQVCWGL